VKYKTKWNSLSDFKSFLEKESKEEKLTVEEKSKKKKK